MKFFFKKIIFLFTVLNYTQNKPSPSPVSAPTYYTCYTCNPTIYKNPQDSS